MDDNEDLNEVLDLTQRQKRAMILRAHKSKIERGRELAKRRMAPEKNIKKRAYAQARQIVRRRFAGARGAEYEKLGPSEKIAIDRAIEKKQALIKKIALRLIPRVKQAEQQRLHSFMKGQSLSNTGAPEGRTPVSEELNSMFEQMVGDIQGSPKTDKQKKDASEKKSKSPIIQYAKFGEESDNVSAVYQAVAKKAGKSGVDIDVLGEVYDRGMEAWTEDMPVSQQQYAFARVNSFINKGKSYYSEDADLSESNNTPYVRPHTEKGSTQQIAWKASNKHGKVKYFGLDFKKSAEKHAGIDEAFSNWTFEMKPGDKTKVIHGDHKGMRGVVVKKHNDGESYTIKHTDGSTMQHHISTLDKPMSEEVQQTNENFMDGKGPGKPGDAARHGLKGKSAAELKKIRSSETASPRKKQLAHFMLNMTKNEETELEEAGLWDNIHAKRKRIKAGSGERMRKPGSEGAPTKQNFVDASEEVQIPDDLNKKLEKISKQLHKSVSAHAKQRDIIKALTSKDKKDIKESLDSDHYKALTDIELNTKNRDMTTQNDGYGPLNPLDEKGSKKFWDEKAKMWKTTPEAAKEARCGNCAFFNQSPPVLKKIATAIGERGETVSELAGFGFCELWEFKCAALRTCNTWVLGGPIKEETENGTQLVDKESKNSKIRKRIEKVDRAAPHTEHGKQQEIQKKIIDEEGNCEPDPKKRLIGTDSLVKAYKKDTPGQVSESINEAFNIAYAAGVGVTLTAADLGMRAQSGFALHPSVVEEMEKRAAEEEVEEEVRSSDIKGVVVHTASGKTVLRKQKVDRKIIGTGNLTDGKPDDTV